MLWLNFLRDKLNRLWKQQVEEEQSSQMHWETANSLSQSTLLATERDREKASKGMYAEEEAIITPSTEINEPAMPGITEAKIPSWASSWLRPAEAENQGKLSADNREGNKKLKEEFEEFNDITPEKRIAQEREFIENLETTDLKEPLNVEVKEMVLRQIQNSRSTARYMCSTANLVEDQIQKAMERGEFNNLKGQGKPLKFQENPYEDPEWRMPFKILKDAGYAPYWVEMGKQLDAEIDGCYMIFNRFLKSLAYRKSRYGHLMLSPDLIKRKEELFESCERKLHEANKLIDQYNMIVPMYWLQKKKLDVQHEIDQLHYRFEEFLKRGCPEELIPKPQTILDNGE